VSTHTKKAGIAALILIYICLFFTARTRADEEHYNNIIIGERAAGLGGAYTAISDDPAGLYYNPAGIIYAKGTNLSASMNAFYSSQKHYDSVLGGDGWDRRSSRLLPNFFGVIQQLPVGKFGFSYAVTDAVKENQDQAFYNVPCEATSLIDPNRTAVIKRYQINLNNQDETYNFGPSYAVEITPSLASGMTLYLHNRKIERIFNQLCILEDGDGRYEWSNLNYELQEWGIRPVIGLMWSPKESKYSLGLTFSHTLLFDSDITCQHILRGLDYDANSIDLYQNQLDIKRAYPYAVTFGAAYFKSHSFLLSGDITYYTDTEEATVYNIATGKTELVFQKRRAIFNLSIGAEYYFTNSLALRFGSYTNMANTYRIENGKINQPEHVNMTGGGISLSYFNRGVSLTLGTLYSYGTGKAQIQADSLDIQNVRMSSLTVYIGASYSL